MHVSGTANDITVVRLVASGGGQPAFAAFRGREYLEEEKRRLAKAGGLRRLWLCLKNSGKGLASRGFFRVASTSDEASLLFCY